MRYFWKKSRGAISLKTKKIFGARRIRGIRESVDSWMMASFSNSLHFFHPKVSLEGIDQNVQGDYHVCFEGPLRQSYFSSNCSCMCHCHFRFENRFTREHTCKNDFSNQILQHALGPWKPAKCGAMHDNETCLDNLDFCFQTAIFIDSMFHVFSAPIVYFQGWAVSRLRTTRQGGLSWWFWEIE